MALWLWLLVKLSVSVCLLKSPPLHWRVKIQLFRPFLLLPWRRLKGVKQRGGTLIWLHRIAFWIFKSPVCLVYHFWIVMPTVSVRKVAVEIFTSNSRVNRAWNVIACKVCVSNWGECRNHHWFTLLPNTWVNHDWISEIWAFTVKRITH